MTKCKKPIIESLANIENKTTHTFFCLPIPPLRVNYSLRFGEFLCYVFSPEEKNFFRCVKCGHWLQFHCQLLIQLEGLKSEEGQESSKPRRSRRLEGPETTLEPTVCRVKKLAMAWWAPCIYFWRLLTPAFLPSTSGKYISK